ncbi:MAG: hypothetical protein ACTS7I_02175 [Candidatus Hodgkinia cicadicola]
MPRNHWDLPFKFKQQTSLHLSQRILHPWPECEAITSGHSIAPQRFVLRTSRGRHHVNSVV